MMTRINTLADKSHHDIPYLNLVKDVLKNGVEKSDRTGVGTIAVFGRQMRFNLSDGTIPLLTTKRIHLPSIIHELLWYLKGDGNIKYLQDNGVRIWNEWADKNGDLGPVYGVMWRKWPYYWWSDQVNGYVKREIDQIAYVINQLKTNPTNRRLIVSSWNPALLPDPSMSFDDNVKMGKQALPPCHYTFQFFAQPYQDTHKLSLLLNMRSNDVGLGNPFNIAQYSILLRMVCEVVDMVPGDFVYSGGDVHIYTNHVDALKDQLTRVPFPSPTLRFSRKIDSIDDFKFEDFVIEGYQHHPPIKMTVAV